MIQTWQIALLRNSVFGALTNPGRHTATVDEVDRAVCDFRKQKRRAYAAAWPPDGDWRIDSIWACSVASMCFLASSKLLP